MRLLVCGPGHPFRGGIAVTTTAMVAAIGERGHDVLFLTPIRQYPRWLYPGGDDRDPSACPRLAGSESLFAPFEPWTWSRARRRALEFAADAWILPYWTWAWGPWLHRLLGSHPRPPAVAVVHNLNDHDGGRLRAWAAAAILRRCDGFFTHADVMRRALADRFPGTPVTASPLPAVAPYGPLPDREAVRRTLGVTTDQRLALFLGLIRPYKGVEDLLEAVAGPDTPSDWRLVVAGEAWAGLDRRLRRQLATANHPERVILKLGWVPDAEVENLVAAADLVVLPYRRGSQSAVAPLALSRGVPVLATNVGGLSEVIEHGRTGWLVRPGPAAIAAGLASLDRERLVALGAGARGTAGPTWAAYAGDLERFLGMVTEDQVRG